MANLFFEYGSLSTITTLDNIISKIQWLQNKFIRLALSLPKYICSKLLHDTAGLPYVKDRPLSCATKSLHRIAQNLVVEESISSNRLNPAWDRFPMTLSVVCPVSLQTHPTYWGNFPYCISLHETGKSGLYVDIFGKTSLMHITA